MNHIARLQTDLSLAIAAITAGDEAIQALRVHLNGDKFRGVETDGAGDRIRLPAPAHFGKSGISANCFVVVAQTRAALQAGRAPDVPLPPAAPGARARHCRTLRIAARRHQPCASGLPPTDNPPEARHAPSKRSRGRRWSWSESLGRGDPALSPDSGCH